MAKKIKGKEWYTIVAPKFFENKVIGETPVDNPKKLIDRKIEVSLVNLINDLRKYHFKLSFRIKKINDHVAETDFAGLECLRDYISRMIHHGIDRLDTVQDLVTKDKKKVTVKALIVVNRRVTKNIQKKITVFVKGKVKKEVEKSTLDDFLAKIIDNSLKTSILKEGSKIYPLRGFEIRKIERPLE